MEKTTNLILMEKASVLLHSLVLNHPFQDGNKPTALTALGLFLRFNGLELHGSPIEIEDLVVNVAEQHWSVPAIVAWLTSHTRSADDVDL